MTGRDCPIAERGVLSLSDAEWQEAKRRADVISPLAALGSVSHAAADAASEALGLRRRTVYELIRRWRAGQGVVTDLAKIPNHRGKGKSRLTEEKREDHLFRNRAAISI